MTDSVIGRTGRVINAPSGLKLHARADLDSERIALLPNGTTFRIRSVEHKFYQVYVPLTGMTGYVWKEPSLDGDIYVELVPAPPDDWDTGPSRKPDAIDWKPWGIGAAIVAALGFILYSCSGWI